LALSDLFSRRRKQDPDGEVGAADAPVYPTKALPRFLANLSTHEQPQLLDLGPVVGTNVNFFGEELGCKILVEDISSDVDRFTREERLGDLPAFLATRFPQAAESIDGILCWDLFDYLDKASAQTLARQLTRLLRPDGVLLAFFSNAEPPPGGRAGYTRHVVVDRNNLQHRPYPGARAKQRPFVNRDIQRMFEPLRVTEQFLLKTNAREVLFRKPPSPTDTEALPQSGTPA
jgi:hypothetical protein